MTGTKRVCKQCGKTIRVDSQKAIYLFLQDTRSGVQEQWVCNRKCLDAYNEGEELDS